MKNQLWALIHQLFEDMSVLQKKAQGVVSVKSKGSMQILKRGIQTEEIIPLRSEVRNKLNFLKAKLGENLTDREVYLVLFPIVIYFDEIVQSNIIEGQYMAWPPLQKELYQIDNGGEIFYELLEDILRKPETIPFIYEVFYFCLNDGFKGKYSDNALKVDEYKSKLHAKIPVTLVDSMEFPSDVPNLRFSNRFPIWYYVASISLIAVVYTLLYFLA